MRARELPFNPNLPPKLQYRIPKVKGILKYHHLSNPTVRQRREDGKLVFKVDSQSPNSSMATLAAAGEISDFLGEEVVVVIRGFEDLVEISFGGQR